MGFSLIIFVFLGVVWIAGTVPSIHWLDSSELACAACTLGISHPPGQIPHAVLGGLFSLLPVGDCAFRVTLLSVAGSWAAVGAVWTWLRGISLGEQVWKAAAVFFFAAALSGLVSTQAVRGEVYGLSAALTLASIAFSGATHDARMNGLAWLFFGVSALNHPVISLAALPFLIRKNSLRWVPYGLLPALGLVYLPLRAVAETAWNFGNPLDQGRFLWFLEGKLYKAYEQPGFFETFNHLKDVTILLFGVLTPVGLLLAAWGIRVLAREKPGLSVRIGFALLLGLIPLAVMTNFWPDNPDVGGYLLVSSWILAAAAAVGIGALWRLGRAWRIILAVLLIGFAVFRVSEFTKDGSLAGDWSANRLMYRLLEEPEISSRVDVASFSTLSFLRYGQIVEGRRPDLDVRYQGLSEAHFPILAWKGRTSSVSRELSIFRGDPGRYTLREQDLALGSRLVPRGWFFALEGQESPEEWARYEEGTRKVLAEMPRPMSYAREPLLLNLLLRGIWEGERGRVEKQRFVFAKVREIFPEFRDYDELETFQ